MLESITISKNFPVFPEPRVINLFIISKATTVIIYPSKFQILDFYNYFYSTRLYILILSRNRKIYKSYFVSQPHLIFQLN